MFHNCNFFYDKYDAVQQLHKCSYALKFKILVQSYSVNKMLIWCYILNTICVSAQFCEEYIT